METEKEHNEFAYYNQALFDNMAYLADAVLEINIAEKSVHVMMDKINPGWNNKNFPLEELQRIVENLSHPDFMEEMKGSLEISFMQSLRNTFYFQTKSRVGPEFHSMQVVMTPSFNEKNGVDYIYITIQDVQSYLNINEERRNIKREYERYLASVSCGILQFSLEDNEILYINSKALEILGYGSREELQADGFNGVEGTVAPEDKTSLKKIVENMRKGKQSEIVDCEYRIVHKDGVEVECLGSFRVVPHVDGKTVLQRSIIDISDAKKKGRLYRETTEILHGANMGLWYLVLNEGSPKFIADATTADLLGVQGRLSEKDTFRHLVSHIENDYIPQIENAVARIKGGVPCEVTYPYNHPVRGRITVRCGGILKKNYSGSGIMIQGYYQDVTDYNARIFEKEAVSRSIARTYDTMYVIDIENGKYEALSTKDSIREYLESNPENDLQKTFWNLMEMFIRDEQAGYVKDFGDFSTLDQRMEGRNFIQTEFLNKKDRWILMSLIRIGNTDEKVKKILFATQDIDDSKRREEKLIQISNTDRMTGTLNRRAYDEKVSRLLPEEIGSDMWMMCVDVNGLKVANDSLGHKAGDEIICGTADCLKLAFCNLGQVYRIGGDEFVVVLRGTASEIDNALDELERYRDKWKGELVKELSFSKGLVCSAEIEECTVIKMEQISDERMYAEKKIYHQING